jgi:prepilin-type processing-associated H-X9-DG protein
LPPTEGIRIADITPVGDKGLNLAFSDGHARGIYPWPYLHDITQSL